MDLQVIYPAINRSDALWDTTVAGGLTVDTNTSKMPALYAQAYKGTDGSNYIVIVNKSAKEHQVTITQDGKAVDKKMTKTFVSAGPSTRNSVKKPDNVKLQEGTSTNPVAVPAYSIIRLEWSDRPAEALSTQLTHAQVTGKDIVTLKWQPLRGVDSYTIQYGTASGKYTDSLKVDQATQHMISGLSSDTPYYFVVYPDTHKELPSNEMSAVITTPSTPQLTRVYPLQDGALGVEWRSVEGATGYKVQYGTSPGSLSSTLDVGNVDGHRLTGLQENTAYYLTVLAYNGSGESGVSDEFSTITEESPAFAPNNLSKASQNGDKVTLNWDSSTEDKGAADAEYKVYRSTKPYPLSEYQLLAKVSGTTYTDSGLTPGQTYYYTVASDRTYGSDPAHPNFRLADNSDDAGPIFGNSNIYTVTVSKRKG